jgi:Cupin-like domain
VELLEFDSAPSTDAVRDGLRAGNALVVRGGAGAWPAMRRHSFEYFADTCGDARVFVRGGRYAYKAFGVVPLRDFIGSMSGRVPWLGGSASVDAEVRAHGGDAADRLYAVYGTLQSSFPELADDVRFADFLYGGVRIESPSWWIGGARCETPFHYDLNSNVFAQIVGRKRFDLVPNNPSVNARMRPLDVFEAGTVYSSIDFTAHPDATTRFPEWRTVTLEPGDVLILPKRVWHQVESLTPSISVQVFFDERRDLAQAARRWGVEARRVLHLAGLHLPGRCTCHATPEVIAHIDAHLALHQTLAARIGRLPAHGLDLAQLAGWRT